MEEHKGQKEEHYGVTVNNLITWKQRAVYYQYRRASPGRHRCPTRYLSTIEKGLQWKAHKGPER